MAATHKCPHNDCQVQVPASRLACREHWYLVSSETRAEVAALWTDIGSPGGATDLYLQARDRAVKEMNSA